MKAKVIETGEIIDVHCLYSTIYTRLDSNGKIAEEYDEDEIELILPPTPKKISMDKACKWLKEHVSNYIGWEYNEFHHAVEYDGSFNKDKFINDFKKAMDG